MNENLLPPDKMDAESEVLVDTQVVQPLQDPALGDTEYARLQLKAALRSDVGAVRQRNEDACLLFSYEAGAQVPSLSFGLYIVADGMGGYDGGDRASKIAARTAARYLLQQIYFPVLEGALAPEADELLQIMHASVLTAHEAVHPEGYAGNGGTTLTISLVLGNMLYIAHVGDSRAYWLVDGVLKRLTHDHSLVQRLQDEGKLTVEEAQNYRYRNVLLRALGQEEDLEVDVAHFTLPSQGKLLLCSDGLCGQISDACIAQLMNKPVSPEEIAEELIAAALDAGGLDNISAILVEFSE